MNTITEHYTVITLRYLLLGPINDKGAFMKGKQRPRKTEQYIFPLFMGLIAVLIVVAIDWTADDLQT